MRLHHTYEFPPPPPKKGAIGDDYLLAEKFDSLLLESIDESVRGVLGEGPLQAMFYSLEKHLGLRREEIPRRLGDFERGLVDLFGRRSAPVIIRIIVRNLSRKLEIPYYQRSDCNFQTYVEECKRRYEKKAGLQRQEVQT